MILVLIIFISSCTSIEEPSLSPSRGITYYVDKDGVYGGTCSNSNDGLSWSSPWCTAAKAGSAVLQPGDTVNFADGTYPIYRQGITSSGTEGNPITYKAYDKEVVLDCGGDNGWYISGDDYLTLDGFKFQNCNSCISLPSYGLTDMTDITIKNIYAGSGGCDGGIGELQGLGNLAVVTNLVIDNITFIDTGGIGLCAGNYVNGPSVKNAVVKNSYFKGGGNIGIGRGNNITYVNNIIIEPSGHSYVVGSNYGGELICDGYVFASNIIIENNICFRCYDMATFCAQNISYIHNTVIQGVWRPYPNCSAAKGSGILVSNGFGLTQESLILKDNLFAQCNTLRLGSVGSGLESDNNYFFNVHGSYEYQGCIPEQTNIIDGEGGYYAYLNDWQSETGQDMNSNQVYGNYADADLETLLVNPLNTINPNFAPREDSWLCQEGNEGSDGETIGALPCSDLVQECYEGTPYGSCSETQPWYCNEGNLEPNCQECLCANEFTCRYDGFCVESKKSRKAIAMPLFSNIKSFLDLF